MTTISLTVNGAPVVAEIDDRMTLADFLRDKLDLTGTHLGCEHGVCGACTVLVDDEPLRACITLAAAMAGRSVRSIESFNDDPTMEVIRDCFSEAHGLQCGFCTPGMVITVRDIVLRGACADAAQIRSELAGNLCRCTGYAGIVKATELTRDRLKAKGE
ncbi:(2Fe-2S)-binding protein [Lacisediminimonas sp.]|uniref:(2Fe-2S)-binding protein n=1 Tax=Lacisediminimonas sp. TaxID=3060582 RepID=UPI00271E2E3F|nr:(2Fe-2S)-binding protein [Lacisediminimonas sp.]MDO8300083.1 (2Fe-2S)-binding protein [Lacisediminimonas sp.]